MVVVKDDYQTSTSEIKQSMLYGEVAAIQAADTGHIPRKEDINEFNMENKDINGLDELVDFGEKYNITEFEKPV